MAAAGGKGVCSSPNQQTHFVLSYSHLSAAAAAAAPPQSICVSRAGSQEACGTKQLLEGFFSHPSRWWDNRSTNKARLVIMVQGQKQGQFGLSTPATSGKVLRAEQLWQDFFSDPSQWWDNRFIKKNPKYPDFERKSTHEALWIEDWLNPPWVKAKLATMALGQIQAGGGLRSWVVDSLGNGGNVSKLCQEGRFKEALHLVELMIQQNIQVPINTYACILKECARAKALAEGKRVHALVVQSGLDSNIFLGNTLVNMYAKCSSVLNARQVFNSMPEHNVFSWTTIISAYANHGQGEEAINLFQQMQQTGIPPNKVTFVVVLKACARIPALEQGKCFHADIIKSGFELDMIVGSALVDMYAKWGCIEDARQVFNNMHEKNVVSWNVMIAGYAQQGLGKEALDLYEQLKQDGVQPTIVTYVVLLKACASIAALEEGKQLHSDIIKSGFELDVIVGSTLVDMYAKCGCMEDARQVFNKMHEQDVVSWTAIITGYAQQGLGKEALDLYKQMKQEGVQPDIVTYLVLLKACASMPALEQGKELHLDIIKGGFESDLILGSTLVDMYAKCGHIEAARQVFNNMKERDVVSWNVMIAGYTQQGLGREALKLLGQMRREGRRPDEVTYVSLLSACSHSGLVDEGRDLFDAMCKDHGIKPNFDHYVCMVDLLGRAGCLADAEDFISKMPIQPNTLVWMTLLGAARNHGHVEIGRRAFDCVVKLDPENAAPYVLLSNIYAAAGQRYDVANVRKEMNNAGTKENAWVQLD